MNMKKNFLFLIINSILIRLSTSLIFFKYLYNDIYLWSSINIKLIEYFFFLLKRQTFLQFKQLLDIIVLDFPDKSHRFDICYVLLSLKYNNRLLFSYSFQENDLLMSISLYYLSANWSEREIWDLFGIFFCNNSDLRRILTDYGFIGYPLRKDFPLTGFVELIYDDEISSLKYVPVELTQNYRIFNFISPWEKI